MESEVQPSQWTTSEQDSAYSSAAQRSLRGKKSSTTGRLSSKKKKLVDLNREPPIQQHPAELELPKRFDEGRFCVAVSLIDGQVRQTSESLE